MKRSLVLALVIALLSLVFMGCGPNTPIDPTSPVAVAPVTVNPVVDLTRSDMEIPASVSPSFSDVTTEDIPLILMPLSGDTFLTTLSADLSEAMTDLPPEMNKVISTFTQNSVSSRSLATDIEADVNDLYELIMDMPESKKFDKTIAYSNQNINDYVRLVSINASAKASLLTTNGAVLDRESLTNLGSLTASGSLSTEIISINAALPEDSSIKDFKIRLNAKANAACGSTATATGRMFNNLNASYAMDLSFGLTIDDGVNAGILIVTVSSKNTVAGLDVTSANFADSLTSDLLITITLYSIDGNTVVYAKSYNNIEDFSTDFIQE